MEYITLNNVSLIKGESLLDTMKSLESQNTSVIRDNERPTILFQMISTLKFMIHDMTQQLLDSVLYHHNLNNISLKSREPNIMIKDSFLSFDIR